MKYLLIIFVLCLGAHGCFSQQDSLPATGSPKNKRQYEAGMNLYSLKVRSGDYYSTYKPIIDNYVFSGLYFKMYYGKNVFRYSFDFLQKLINNKKGYYDTPSHIVSSKSLQLSAGYQRLLGHKRLTPYVFADFNCSYTRELRSVSDPGPGPWLFSDYYYNYTSYVSRSSMLVGLSPGLGLKIRLCRNMVINLESSAQFFYEFVKPPTSPNETNRAIGINARPLQCSLGFTF